MNDIDFCIELCKFRKISYVLISINKFLSLHVKYK